MAAYQILRDRTDDVELLVGADSTGGMIGTMTSSTLSLRTSNGSRLAIDSSGNVSLPTAGTSFQLLENGTTDAAAGASNTARLYCRDNGAGKTQLMVRFASGASQVIATEP